MNKHILVVCKGNIHRSVIAEFCIRKKLVETGNEEKYSVASRGVQGTLGVPPSKFPNIRLYEEEWRLAAPSLLEVGVDIPIEKQATPISRDDIEMAAVVFAMDNKVLQDLPYSLLVQFPDFMYKIKLFKKIAGLHGDVSDCEGEKEGATFRRITM